MSNATGMTAGPLTKPLFANRCGSMRDEWIDLSNGRITGKCIDSLTDHWMFGRTRHTTDKGIRADAVC